MKTVSITEVNALKAYEEASDKFKKLLEDLIGKEFFQRNIMDRVKTFEDACSIEEPSANMKILLDYNGVDQEMLAAQAFAKLSHIRKVLNEGWVPDWTNSSEYKYYPWFKHEAGFGLSYGVYAYTNSSTNVGSRLCFKSSELAIYAGKQFSEIYNQYLTIQS